MNKLIFDNERKIEKFDFDNCIKYKNYKMASAVRALNVANDITKAYFKEEKALSKEDYVLRLYALLQGMFVSIDSLYCLGEAITGNNLFAHDQFGYNSAASLRDAALLFCICLFLCVFRRFLICAVEFLPAGFVQGPVKIEAPDRRLIQAADEAAALRRPEPQLAEAKGNAVPAD